MPCSTTGISARAWRRQGYRRLIGIGEVQEALGVPASVPQLGYIFQEGWADAHADSGAGVRRAPRAPPRQIMLTSDAEWQRLMPVTRAENEAELDGLHAPLPRGHRRALGRRSSRPRPAELYLVLAELGGEKLVGSGTELAPGTFWPKVSY